MGSFTASTAPHDTAISPGEMESLRMGITKIWKGDQVLIKDDGYAYSAYATGAAGDQFVGVAAETVDNTAGAVGDKEIRCWQEGIFEFTCAASNINTALGLACYNERGATGTPTTVTTTAGASGCQVGNIVELIPVNGAVTASVKCRVRITAWSAVAT